MDCTRRDFNQLACSTVLALLRLPGLAIADTAVHVVKMGITTGSLNPLPDLPGKDRLAILIEECVQLGCGNVELAAGFFGPALRGAAIGGQMPKTITPEYQTSREQLRKWRLSSAALDQAREINQRHFFVSLDLF